MNEVEKIECLEIDVKEEIVSLVLKSRYLILLKDRNVFHLRLNPMLEIETYLRELVIAEGIIEKFNFLCDSDVSGSKSGDINRILLASGTELN